MTDQIPALAFLLPFVTAISLPLVGRWKASLCRPLAIASVSVMAVVAALGIRAVFTVGQVRYSLSGWTPPVGIEWVADEVAAVMVGAIGFLATICLLYSGSIGDRSANGRAVPYYTLILLLVAGLTGTVYAADLFNIFVLLEVVALAGYALVAVQGGRALMSAFRYLIMGSLATTFYLLGVVYFYAATGALNMADLGEKVPALLGSKAVLGGLIFMFIGLAIKMALVPLHAWLPDAYTDASDAVAPLLAGLLTKVVALVWVRILFWAMAAENTEQGAIIYTLVSALGIVASVAGALLALTQRQLKRIFAYGGISHVGLVLVGASQANQTGVAGSLYYLVNDAVMQCALFMIAGIVASKYGARTLDDLGRAHIRSPWVLGAFVIVSLGMIGLPPTGGFFGKWYILLGALEASNFVAAGAIVLATLLTLAYLLRILERLIRKGETESGQAAPSTPWPLKVSLAAPAAAVVALGIWVDPILGGLLDAVGGLGL